MSKIFLSSLFRGICAAGTLGENAARHERIVIGTQVWCRPAVEIAAGPTLLGLPCFSGVQLRWAHGLQACVPTQPRYATAMRWRSR